MFHQAPGVDHDQLSATNDEIRDDGKVVDAGWEFDRQMVSNDGVHVLPKGTPLVQVIPFRRTDAAIGASVRPESTDEAAERKRTHRAIGTGNRWCRRYARGPRI